MKEQTYTDRAEPLYSDLEFNGIEWIPDEEGNMVAVEPEYHDFEIVEVEEPRGLVLPTVDFYISDRTKNYISGAARVALVGAALYAAMLVVVGLIELVQSLMIEVGKLWSALVENIVPVGLVLGALYFVWAGLTTSRGLKTSRDHDNRREQARRDEELAKHPSIPGTGGNIIIINNNHIANNQSSNS